MLHEAILSKILEGINSGALILIKEQTNRESLYLIEDTTTGETKEIDRQTWRSIAERLEDNV